MHLNRMKDVRKSRGLSQREFAAKLGDDQSKVSKVENGMSTSRTFAEKAAKVLVCRVEDLVEPTVPTITLKVTDLTPEMLQTLTRK